MSWLQACQHFHYNPVFFTELKLTIKMMCAGMKLGTRCSQSGSPFLNLILQNWKTLSHLKFIAGSPLCSWLGCMRASLSGHGASEREQGSCCSAGLGSFTFQAWLSLGWQRRSLKQLGMSGNWHQAPGGAKWWIHVGKTQLPTPHLSAGSQRLVAEEKQL